MIAHNCATPSSCYSYILAHKAGRISRSYFWVIDHEKIADKRCFCATVVKAISLLFAEGIRSFRGFFFGGSVWRAIWRFCGLWFWSAEMYRTCSFSLITIAHYSLGIYPPGHANINKKYAGLRRELIPTLQITAQLRASQQGSWFQFRGFWCDSFCVFGSFLAELCTFTLQDCALLRCCHDTYLESFVCCQLIKH